MNRTASGRETLPAGSGVPTEELEAWAAAIIGSGLGGAVPLPYKDKYPNPAGFQGGKNDDSKCCSVPAVNRVIASGFKARDPETGRLRNHTVGGMGLRPADGVIGIDVDAYGRKQGAETLARLEEQLGRLPRTYYLTSRGAGQPSRIRLFRATPGQRYGDPGGDIEVVQHHWRYAVFPPSVHPEGRPYVLYGPDDEVLALPSEMPGIDDITQLPASWDIYLGGLYRRENEGKASAGSAEYRAWIQEHGTYIMCRRTRRTTAYWLARQERQEPREGEKFSNHIWAVDAAYAIIGDCAAGHDGASEALWTLRRAFEREGEARGHSVPSLVEDWIRIVQGAIAQHGMPGERPECDCAQDVSLNLPDEFWEYMRQLEDIRQAAYSRGRSADAVFGTVLARMGAMAPPALRFEVGLGPSPLSVFTALCGDPDTGKSKSATAGVDMLPDLPYYPGRDPNSVDEEVFSDEVPVGTGEGIVEAFYEYVREESASGRPRTAHKRTKFHAFFFEDEGQKLIKNIDRANSVVAETLRSIWTGAGVGQKNASQQTTRQLRRDTYSIGIVVGFQPGTIGGLLKDDEALAGTPQRFLYLSATDPNVPSKRTDAPDWPGALELTWPARIEFPESVKDEVWENNYLSSSGTKTVRDVWTAHSLWYRTRIAALLAVLRVASADEVASVTPEDWEWSLVVWEVSCANRDAMLGEVKAEAARQEGRHRETIAGRAVAVDTAKTESSALYSRAVGIAARHVQARKARCIRAGGCKRKCITNAIGSELRKQVRIEAVLTLLVADGYVAEPGSSGIYVPGEVPAP
jgi:hypothetical protein